MKTLFILVALCGTAVGQWSPNCAAGRTTIVHLFEWRWTDIAAECERFLGPYGYCGVQISPPHEHPIVFGRPWWERYQCVSYKLVSRGGDEEQFKNMVERCNNVGVRIYVDTVFNHMTGGGRGHGSAGTWWDADALDYPGVPFSPWDFHSCQECGTSNCEIHDYENPHQSRVCMLGGLRDLKVSKDYVRHKVAEYMNKLIDMGVAGFRLDAAKHMWPEDIRSFMARTHDLNQRWFHPHSRAFIVQEIVDLSFNGRWRSEYLHLGRVTEFKYGMDLGNVFRKNNGQKLAQLSSFGDSWGYANGNSALVFIDNHDNQRGHGAGNFHVILTYFDARLYKLATAFMLAFPFGTPRVMSSYHWDRYIEHGKDVNDWKGPPTDEHGNVREVIINPDMSCSNGWVCEHRWRQIFHMVQFRNVVGVSKLRHWWDNGNNQVAFSREGRGFIAINNEGNHMDQWLNTGMKAGRYCDVMSGANYNGACTGRTIQVNEDGWAHIELAGNAEDPMVAIHIGSAVM